MTITRVGWGRGRGREAVVLNNFIVLTSSFKLRSLQYDAGKHQQVKIRGNWKAIKIVHCSESPSSSKMLVILSCYGSIPVPYGDWEGTLWFEYFVSKLRICLSAEGAKNVLWPWLSVLRGWVRGSLTMAFLGKLIYVSSLSIYLSIYLSFYLSLIPWKLISFNIYISENGGIFHASYKKLDVKKCNKIFFFSYFI